MNFPTYEQMVQDLFKKLRTPGEEAHHATTGIAGEVGELSEACSRENILEELGDIEFYLEALRQRVVVPETENVWSYGTGTFGTTLLWMHTCSARLLDLTKKSWIYGKPLPMLELSDEILQMDTSLLGMYEYLGTTRAEVRCLNQIKLMKRYPAGYTNEAAIARADKNV